MGVYVTLCLRPKRKDRGSMGNIHEGIIYIFIYIVRLDLYMYWHGDYIYNYDK